MAIPGDAISSIAVPGNWLYPDNIETGNLVDYELGGVALNDTSQGLRFQKWTLAYDSPSVVVRADNYGIAPWTEVFSAAGVTELSLAFDQNMRPFVAFVQGGVAKFFWYNTEIADTAITPLPADTLTPRCCLDDKRETQTNNSDILLFYVNSNNVYMRRQRDRYEDEIFMRSAANSVLQKVGMTDQNRLQFLMRDPDPIEGPC